MLSSAFESFGSSSSRYARWREVQPPAGRVERAADVGAREREQPAELLDLAQLARHHLRRLEARARKTPYSSISCALNSFFSTPRVRDRVLGLGLRVARLERRFSTPGGQAGVGGHRGPSRPRGRQAGGRGTQRRQAALGASGPEEAQEPARVFSGGGRRRPAAAPGIGGAAARAPASTSPIPEARSWPPPGRLAFLGDLRARERAQAAGNGARRRLRLRRRSRLAVLAGTGLAHVAR